MTSSGLSKLAIDITIVHEIDRQMAKEAHGFAQSEQIERSTRKAVDQQFADLELG